MCLRMLQKNCDLFDCIVIRASFIFVKALWGVTTTPFIKIKLTSILISYRYFSFGLHKKVQFGKKFVLKLVALL